MATVINNPSEGGHVHESDSSSWIVGIILLIMVVLFLVYGLPAIRGGGDVTVNNPAPQPQQQAPQSDSDSGINVDVPEEINVNVNQPNDPQPQQ